METTVNGFCYQLVEDVRFWVSKHVTVQCVYLVNNYLNVAWGCWLFVRFYYTKDHE